MQELIAAAALSEARANLSAAVRTGAGARELAQRREVVAALEHVLNLMRARQPWQAALQAAFQQVVALEGGMAQAVAALPAPARVALPGAQRRRLN